MNITKVLDIINKWKEIVHNINKLSDHTSPHFQNVERAILLLDKLLEYLDIYQPVLHHWMTEYLDKYRKNIFVQWYSDHVSKWADSHARRVPEINLYPNTMKEWDSIFGENTATCFSLAQRVVDDIHKRRMDMSLCDDLTIIEIHEGKEHDGDEWECYRCEEQEREWEAELLRRIKNSQHPLLNPDRRNRLLWREFPSCITKWIPPHFWGNISTNGYFYGNKPCYTKEEYETFLLETLHSEYKKIGQTRFQAITALLKHVFYNGKLEIKIDSNLLRDTNSLTYSKKEYDVFLCLWNCLDLIPFAITLYGAHLQEIKQML